VLDGVKLIDADIADGESPATYRQERCALSPTARLLLRLEGLDQYLEEIRTESGYQVELVVTPTPDIEAKPQATPTPTPTSNARPEPFEPRATLPARE
jgi:hypothetical protein